MINRGGENVYPREVEDLLKLHKSIIDAQVFGVPDTRMGEEPAVWIKLRNGAPTLSADDVKEFCKSQVNNMEEKFHDKEKLSSIIISMIMNAMTTHFFYTDLTFQSTKVHFIQAGVSSNSTGQSSKV